MSDYKLIDFINALSAAPTTQLDASIIKICGEQSRKDNGFKNNLLFLRNLRDWCVRGGLSSDFLIKAISIMIDEYTETENDKAYRRDNLEKNGFSNVLKTDILK